jgi:uncharacterized membrane protein
VTDLPPLIEFSAPQSFSGHLTSLEGRLTFLPCAGGPDAIAIADSPDRQGAQVLEQLGSGDRPIPVMLRLRADTLSEVRHAAPEGGGCDRLPGEGDLNALGNEPFWHLGITGQEAVMRTPELPDGERFPGGRWTRPDSSSWRYQAPAGSIGDAVVLELHDRRCQDGMSGAWFPYQVTVQWGGQHLSGCALEGVAAQRSP